MNWNTRAMTGMCGVTVLGLAVAVMAQTATTQPTADANSKTGTVKGDNVYVRSGFSTNYYPVTKLNQGDQVTILGEEYGWLNIAPPAGTHSLIEKTLVNRIDDRSGTLNGDAWVYAGSNIDNRRYARQVKLVKGDKVDIIGETSDGAFFKIMPPPGATVWISAELVDRGGKKFHAEAGPKPPVIEPVKTGDLKLTENLPELDGAGKPADADAATQPTEVKDIAAPSSEPKSAPVADRSRQPVGLRPMEKFQIELNAIETEIEAEEAKPFAQRNYTGVIEKLRPIAEQKDDEVAGLYAQARMSQMKDQMDLIKGLSQMQAIREEAMIVSKQHAQSREAIRSELIRGLDDIVVRGEIKVSGIYDGSASRPRRWRVVDPGRDRTLAYIELPPDSPINPVHFYGRYVGIRASGRQVLSGTIPPLPIYTVQEIVPLDPGASRYSVEPTQTPAPVVPMESTGRLASPAPPAVASPSSQPSAAGSN